jgi:hypothetical protein
LAGHSGLRLQVPTLPPGFRKPEKELISIVLFGQLNQPAPLRAAFRLRPARHPANQPIPGFKRYIKIILPPGFNPEKTKNKTIQHPGSRIENPASSIQNKQESFTYK